MIQRFLTNSCRHLTRLLLDSCSFVDDDVIDALATSCLSLTHLSLSSCQKIAPSSFEKLKSLTHLVGLNLYRTLIDQKSIVEIVKACDKLRELNLGSCVNVSDFDQLIEVISSHGRQFECLDFWRANTLTQFGMNLLSTMSFNLKEIDIGWWYV